MSFERYKNLVEMELQAVFGPKLELSTWDIPTTWLSWLIGYSVQDTVQVIIDVESNSSITFYSNGGGE